MHLPTSQPLRRALPQALALSAALSLGTASAQEAIIIGASLPLSGSQAVAGKEGQAIMQAQIDAFNRERSAPQPTHGHWQSKAQWPCSTAGARPIAPPCSPSWSAARRR